MFDDRSLLHTAAGMDANDRGILLTFNKSFRKEEVPGHLDVAILN
jgi:hypothetical protein